MTCEFCGDSGVIVMAHTVPTTGEYWEEHRWCHCYLGNVWYRAAVAATREISEGHEQG